MLQLAQLYVYGNVMYFSWNLWFFSVSVSMLQRSIDEVCTCITGEKLDLKNKVLRQCYLKVQCVSLLIVILFCNSTDLIPFE